MNTRVVFFPFDLFGGGGCAAGVDLLEESLAEILTDQKRETVSSRADAYAGKVRRTRIPLDNLDEVRNWRERARRVARQALQRNDFLLWISGNHLGVLPVYDELSQLDNPGVVIQFDAHLDIHHFGACNPEPTHGNFLMHCAGPLPPVVNLGHRDQLIPQEHWQKYYKFAFPVNSMIGEPFDAVWEANFPLLQEASRIWIDLDWDVLDPAYFPAVSRPVPFGLAPVTLLGIIDQIPRERLAGVFLSEFEPGRDRQDQCLATVVWLLEHLLLKQHDG